MTKDHASMSEECAAPFIKFSLKICKKMEFYLFTFYIFVAVQLQLQGGLK